MLTLLVAYNSVMYNKNSLQILLTLPLRQ